MSGLPLPDHLRALMEKEGPLGPLHRQFAPSNEEALITPDELRDPIGDRTHSPVKGIIHRYSDRVLLTPVHVCPVYCRYCFRKNDVGPAGGNGALTTRETAAALAYIREDKNIWEVILSGGDPLMLSAEKLGRIIAELATIDHLGVIRLHTRMPLADPQRITPDLVRALAEVTDKAVYMVIHCNHSDELSPQALDACRRLSNAGIPLLAQSVLLKGVNDDEETLTRLLRTLTKNRIKPYYLHHCDLAQGTSHFRTTIAQGQSLMRLLRGKISGLCQPTYVLDIPGGFGKVPVGPSYLEGGERDGTTNEIYEVHDIKGKKHPYP